MSNQAASVHLVERPQSAFRESGRAPRAVGGDSTSGTGARRSPRWHRRRKVSIVTAAGWIARVAGALLRGIVQLQPAGFRRRFGAEIIEDTEDQIRAAIPFGARATAATSVAALADAARGMIAERSRAARRFARKDPAAPHNDTRGPSALPSLGPECHHGIDSRGAPRRQIARHRRDHDQHGEHGREGQRIAGGDFEQ